MPRKPSATQRRRPARPPVKQTENTSRQSEPVFPEPTLPRHFFRIISENIIQAKKLHIPLRLFNKRVGRTEQLSDVATLSVSNGNRWQVKAEKDREHIWFVGGWSNFVQDNGICHNYLVSFEYKGNSCFKVTIFDPTTFEISEYGKKEKTKQENEKVSKSEDTIEISDTVLDDSPKTKTQTSPRMKKNNKKKEVKVYTSIVYKKSLAEASNGSKEADRKADECKPKHDAIKALLQENTIKRNILIVPHSFARECMKKVYGKATFKCSDKEEFPVKVAGWGGVGKKMTFRGGWAAFSKHLKLKLGDVLILEQSRNGMFEVKVFRS